jgi:hypothetical protein
MTTSSDLIELLERASRCTFGFVDEYEPNKLLHPWVVQHFTELGKGHLLDLGAGITPLPLVLASLGHCVDTVDGSDIVRSLPADETWNGWGFFDYSKINGNIRSYRCLAEDYVPDRVYDAAYSIGMIAHMEGRSRRSVLERLKLVDGGLFYFTVSLVPGTDLIWNRREGHVVESVEKHGHIHDLLSELRLFNYRVCEQLVLRNVVDSETDFLLLGARR